VGPSTIKTLGAKWGAGGGHIGFDRYQPTEKEKELIEEFSQDKPSPEIEKEGQKFIEGAEGRSPEKRSAEDYLVLATDKWRAKKYEEAFENVYAGLALEPRDVRIKANLVHRKASIFHYVDSKMEAAKIYKEAMSIDPKLFLPHYNLGCLYHEDKEKQKNEEAQVEYRKAIELDSEFSAAHYNLGILYHDQGKKVEAEEEYKKALELDPENPRGHFNLGLLYEEQKKWELAKQQFEKLSKLTLILRRQKLV
jgi:tetratricopeptide (TPR) repeat protein